MVFLSLKLFNKPIRRFLKDGFMDSLRIHVSGGAGGNGLPKFGGVGGKGGDVIVEAKEGITLNSVFRKNQSKKYAAKPGKSASHNFVLGPPGEDLVFDVPIGVTIITDAGKNLGELNTPGEKLVLAKGGTGGHSKNGFLGTRGQVYPVNLDLKLIADVGLVGFPNAGKSTLLRAISDARPKVADYPFRPHLGVIKYDDHREITVADLPGLIEGAYANQGMGHLFLKHVERTKLLLMIVDINGFQLSQKYPYRTCLETIMLLTKELESYNEDLLTKPSMLLINKMDTEGANEKYEEIKEQMQNFRESISKFDDKLKPSRFLSFSDIVPISAKENEKDIKKVKIRLRALLDVMSDLDKNTNENITREVRESQREKGPILV